MLKRDSTAWALAKKYARRKYTLSRPLELCIDGSVLMFGLLYGNEYKLTENDLRLLINR